MGRYATTTSISVLMPGFLNAGTTTSDAFGTDVWSAASDRAEGEVNSSIVARYDPSAWTTGAASANVPPLVRKITEDLACLYAFRASMVQDSQVKNPNLVEWQKAEDLLGDITEGKRKLAYTDGSLVPTRSSSKIVSSTNYSHIFALDNERTWQVDSKELSDIATDRGNATPDTP